MKSSLQNPLNNSLHSNSHLLSNHDLLDMSHHSSIIRLHPATAVVEEQDLRIAFRSKKDFMIGALWLAVCILSSATIGPIVLMIPAKSPYVSITWRCQGCILLMALWCIGSYVRESRKREKEGCGISEDQRVKTWEKILKDSSVYNLASAGLMAVFGSIWCFGLVLGCKYTLTAHADVLYCSNGVFILLIAIFTCQYVHKYEIIGYIIYGIGAVIMLSDPLANKIGEEMNKPLGNLIAIIGALGGALYGITSTKMRRDNPQEVALLHIFVGNFILQIIAYPYFDENPLFFSFDPEFGIFGWVSDPWIFMMMFLFICPWTGILVNYSLLECYRYWTLDIVAVFFLTEPYFAEITAIILGQDKIPGFQTFIGIGILSLGILLSINGSKIKATEEAKTSNKCQEEDDIELPENV
ncbi:unnamed protein product [Moneuplotes crassus]|uniref:EamA domain-containing protein n=1 Tax=Euplotes crassus TaxID=5936 RepID=A0AAD1UF53_EUPCR|nr:unnamed protein product [Moneuplotes crassus]